jgi:hypothetical protein
MPDDAREPGDPVTSTNPRIAGGRTLAAVLAALAGGGFGLTILYALLLLASVEALPQFLRRYDTTGLLLLIPTGIIAGILVRGRAGWKGWLAIILVLLTLNAGAFALLSELLSDRAQFSTAFYRLP